MSLKVAKIKMSDLLVELTYLSILFLIPLYFNFFFPSFDPFESSKMILFRSLVWFLLFLSIWRFFGISGSGEKILIFTKKYLLVFLALLFFMFLSLLWSVDAHWSFWGNFSRQISLHNELFFVVALFLLAVNLFLSKNIKKAVERIFWTVTISSFLVSLYAICQYFGLDFLTWQEAALETKRAMSSLGQPNFLGSFLLLTIPLSFYLARYSKNIYGKIFLDLVLLSQLLALLFSGSRGAWLGLMAVLVVVFLVYKKSRKITLIIGSSFIVMALTLFFTNNVFSQRFKGAFNLSEGSSSVRTFLYNNSWQASLDNPLGFGLENQREALIPYYEISSAEKNKVNVIFDRAHNVFLDIILSLGFLGLIIYLYLYYFIFKIIRRNFILGEKDKDLFLILGLSILAFLVSICFNFATVVTIIYLYFIIAIIFALDFRKKNDDLFQEKIEADINLGNYKKVLRSVIILSVTLLSVWGLNREFKNWRADYYFSQIQNNLLGGEVPTAMELFSYFQENKPLPRAYYDVFISLIFDNINYMNDSTSRLFAKEKAALVAELYYQKDGQSFFYNLNKAQALALVGKFDESWTMFYELEKTSPFYPDIYLKEARLAQLQKNNDLAREKYQKVLELLPAEEEVEGDINLGALLHYKRIINNSLLSLE